MHRNHRSHQGNRVFVYEGAEIACVANVYGSRTVLVIGGFQVEADLTLFVAKAEFVTIDSTIVTIDQTDITIDNSTPPPRCSRTLSFAGTTFRIDRLVDLLPGDPEGMYEIVCIDPTK